MIKEFQFLNKNTIINIEKIILFINLLIIILLMEKTKNSYKKSGVNISLANTFVKHIAKISKKRLNLIISVVLPQYLT